MRERVKLPIIHFVHETVELYKQRTRKGVNNVRDILFRGSVIAFIVSLLVWLSVFMYVAFYYSYVPEISHERPVYLQFKSCGEAKGVCSFPSAHVLLTKRQQLLMYGQPYKVHLNLELPESPTNKELGMFMVCADFRGKDGKLITHSCRATMLHYRSNLLQTIYTVAFSPLLLFGTVEEKQQLTVELFSDFQETESQPVTDVYIEIQSRFIQLYSAKFLIHAHFSGIRYIMFQWPILSAAIGITSNLFFIAVLCVTSWYQLINSEEYINYKISKQRALQLSEKRLLLQKRDNDDSSSIDDSSFVEEFPDTSTRAVQHRSTGKKERDFVEVLS